MQVLIFTLELFQCKNGAQKLGAQSIVRIYATGNISEVFRRTLVQPATPKGTRLAARWHRGILHPPAASSFQHPFKETVMQVVEAHGARIPQIGLGTMTLKDDACVRAVDTALQIGYRHLDTAAFYGNEKEN